MLGVPRVPPVGLDPIAAKRLQGLLDASAEALRGCADRVQVLLDEAGVACTVPAEIRIAAGWCGGTGATLGGRISLIDRPLGRTSANPTVGDSGVATTMLPTPVTSHSWLAPSRSVVVPLPGLLSLSPPGSVPGITFHATTGPDQRTTPHRTATLLGRTVFEGRQPSIVYSKPDAAPEDEDEEGVEEPEGETTQRPPVTDLPRDEGGNVIGGTGAGKGETLSGEEAEAVRDYEAGRTYEAAVLARARRKIVGQEKYQRTRNRQKR